MMALFLSAMMAQQPRLIDVRHADIVTVDGGVMSVDGGAWLSDERLIEYATTQKNLKLENEKLKPQPMPLLVVGAVVVGFLGGFVAAVALLK